MNRFTQGNSRRYFRYSIQCKYFVSPELLESSTDIYSNGIDYFNRATEDSILHLKTQVMHKLHRLRAHQATFLQIVTDIFDKFDVVMGYLQMLNRGQEIASRKIYLQNHQALLGGFKGIKKLEDDAPKTYELLLKIEQKFVLYTQMIQETIDNSTRTKLHVCDYPEAFRFTPEIRLQFVNRGELLNSSDLLQMILSIEQLFEKGFEPFNNLATDYLLFQKHDSWIKRELNISACGLAFTDSRAYPNLTRADVKLSLDDSYAEVVRLDGKIVRSRYLPQQNLNQTAIDFYFPKSVEQKQLLGYLHRLETIESMQGWAHAGNQ
ncbi:hypothetical protein THMIRHAS_07700 [Thiosulfatimonas sediminis]|uniref:PilZ domain-containing protein n=1 Tax=Thiosulfatimonas sediminis TaxID=2675054 RepID=A0A6F8PTP0_9GAMM|nr:hypothetical protein [Thiosulfatimonas sediminis]BBP45397.1 hypothetical protein THMIRHAS_07700 [Thiosulfatimonas sediminis]